VETGAAAEGVGDAGEPEGDDVRAEGEGEDD